MNTGIEEKYKSKWNINIENKSDSELKQIAKDIHNGLIFTDRHIRDNNILCVFMTLIIMRPGSDSNGDDANSKRDNLIYELLEREFDEKYYNEYINNIGLIYEYYRSAGPRSVNGNPSFFSHRTLNKKDTERMFVFFEEYKSIRETVDNF